MSTRVPEAWNKEAEGREPTRTRVPATSSWAEGLRVNADPSARDQPTTEGRESFRPGCPRPRRREAEGRESIETRVPAA